MYEPFQFVGRCSEGGYEWRGGRFAFLTGTGSTEEREGPALVPIGNTERQYVPRPDLFFEFAAVDPDNDEAVLAFANRYGLLGASPAWLFRKPQSRGVATTDTGGELRSHWQEHLRGMRAAASLWEALRKQDSKRLSQCIHWRGKDRVEYVWPPSADWSTPWSTHAVVASKQINQHLLERCRPGDPEMAARLYLQEVVNKNLNKLVAPRLLWTAPERSKMGLFIVPNALIGCLWLQLANAIADYRKFVMCESCGKPMLVAPEGTGARTNKRTCSDACRTRVHARRKTEARQLRHEGMPVAQIAKHLRAEVTQIKRWIAER